MNYFRMLLLHVIKFMKSLNVGCITFMDILFGREFDLDPTFMFCSCIPASHIDVFRFLFCQWTIYGIGCPPML